MEKIRKISHLKSHIDSTISNLIDVWQRSSIDLASVRSQLQILSFLQLQLEEKQDKTTGDYVNKRVNMAVFESQ